MFSIWTKLKFEVMYLIKSKRIKVVLFRSDKSPKHEIPLFLGDLIQISDKCTIDLSFYSVTLTQYAFILTFMVSLNIMTEK